MGPEKVITVVGALVAVVSGLLSALVGFVAYKTRAEVKRAELVRALEILRTAERADAEARAVENRIAKHDCEELELVGSGRH